MRTGSLSERKHRSIENKLTIGDIEISRAMAFKALTRYTVAFSLLLATACSRGPEPKLGSFQPSPPAARHITFVQWTDPHVFDAGKGRTAEGVREEELDNWAAFHWAVLQTNRLVLTEHRS